MEQFFVTSWRGTLKEKDLAVGKEGLGWTILKSGLTSRTMVSWKVGVVTGFVGGPWLATYGSRRSYLE